jgi:hypothetical protein
MTDQLSCVVVPHGRFLEYRDRRREKAAPPAEPDGQKTIDVDVDVTPAEAVAVLPQTPNGKQC